MYTIAQNLRDIEASIKTLKSESIAEWQDELGNTFAYDFVDGSSVIYYSRLLACSTKALERWCKNGRIDNLLREWGG